ncbi:hypothetical protein CIK05_13565 [Bdellovibrio sp. qaytius]|nr:hypothetical protein CIK05_13565 [Bdellovibrio sp. qaytius]
MDIKARLKQSLQQHKYFVFMFFFFIFVYIYTTVGSDVKPAAQEKLLTMDTLIPNGYALVPIELENIAAIASLIEGYGVVDIYLGKSASGRSKKIFQKVKILRAPNNPHAYSLLLPDNLSSVLMQYDGPFFAVIQNKSETSANPAIDEHVQTKKTVKIEYNGG